MQGPLIDAVCEFAPKPPERREQELPINRVQRRTLSGLTQKVADLLELLVVGRQDSRIGRQGFVQPEEGPPEYLRLEVIAALVLLIPPEGQSEASEAMNPLGELGRGSHHRGSTSHEMRTTSSSSCSES